ncbi:MAG: alginate export family protein [Chitinophagaceae bacterium]|nr:alginate export family protein [Chitinophagaceae bacterium]
MAYIKLAGKILSATILFTTSFIPFSGSAQTDEAENTFSVSGQLRPRLEFRDGAFTPLEKGQDPAALISERIRLNMDYNYKDVLTIRLSPQAVGVWGQESMVQGAENSGNKIALFEAWSQVKLGREWDMKLGRQVISLDDERFFGELDWAQGARAHDALSFLYHKDNYEVKAFLAYNQNYKANYNNNLNNPTGNIYNMDGAFTYKWMQAIWTGIPVSESSKISFLFANVGMQNSTPLASAKTFFSQTIGSNFTHSSGQWGLNLAAYYQGGKSGLNSKVSAYMLAAGVTYKPDSKWTLGLESDWLSGNDVGSVPSKDKVFNPYFHTGHKFYGSMDYFANGSSVKGAGLADNYLKANYKANEKLSLMVTLHQFTTPNEVRGLTESYSKSLGQEADLSFALKLNKFTTMAGGYSFYLTNNTLRFLKNAFFARGYQQWAWLTFNVNPVFFKTKW